MSCDGTGHQSTLHTVVICSTADKYEQDDVPALSSLCCCLHLDGVACVQYVRLWLDITTCLQCSDLLQASGPLQQAADVLESTQCLPGIDEVVDALASDPDRALSKLEVCIC